MTRFRILAVILFISLPATVTAELIIYEFPMDGGQNVPVRESGGTADCRLTLDDQTRLVTVECTYEDLTSTAINAHVHGLAGPDMNGGVLIPLGVTGETSGMITGNGTLSENDMAGLIDGMTYINLHTQNFTGGEIRGLIVQTFKINAGLNDAWVSEGAPFQGLFFTVFEDLGLIFLSWFTFDSMQPDDSDSAVFGAIDQRWVTGAGSYFFDSVTINVELTSGGIFNGSDPTASQTANYGTITIRFISCNEAILTYEFPSISLSGEMTLNRVLEDNVALCELLGE